jgi:isoquinoline 1-oxidoreductase alpha subunit
MSPETIRFELNGEAISLEIEDDTPLLWVLRDEIGLTGEAVDG